MSPTAPLVFLDTETTGLHPDRRIWELAMIRVTEKTERTVSVFVADVDLAQADLKALQLGRFHDRHPNHRPTTGPNPEPLPSGVWSLQEATVAQKVEAWTRGATIVGAVPSFDTEGLAAMLRRHGLCPSWHHRLVCVESMALPHVGWGTDGRPMGLAALAEKLDIEHEDADLHTALADAQLAQRIFEHLVVTR
ncbi:Exonuclease [Rhodococcoides kroppenstedtii]|uniref:Exonuclease n=1 Tax=Rhodococcoides kroppenstedtii TaxID=293050 RepID=A0A1I0UAI3_9NOCA|nr:exonuclease domain-containing protein [Rhodococcus kroppenstedtii]SFA60893.1 Exonuclease [Rhodococcus kroppenstedtii]